MGISISKIVWQNIIKTFKIPHYSYTKRIGIAYEQSMPLLYGVGLIPILPDFSFQNSLQPEKSKRIYYDLCLQCFSENMIYDTRLDINVCKYCGNTSISKTHWNHVRSSRRILKCRQYNPDFYKRIGHFKQWLYRLQGKEKNTVTATDIEKIQNFLKGENTKRICFWTIKNALRRLQMKHHYSHTAFIMKVIRGSPVFEMSSQQQNALIQMFVSLSDVYEQVVKQFTKTRVNMLSYPYIIRKLCELKRWNRVSKVIPFLKSHSSIIQQDQIWSLVCKLKGWTFIPTKPWSEIDHRSADRKPQ